MATKAMNGESLTCQVYDHPSDQAIVKSKRLTVYCKHILLTYI
jgi:hypothetical protein